MPFPRRILSALVPGLVPGLLLGLAVLPARADEGMWLSDSFPTERVRAAYGWAPDAQWLEHVRRSTLRLASGCSASLVSADGLVMTNHHCVEGCLTELSRPGSDLAADGLVTASLAEERRCTGMAADRLEAATDVSARVAQATEGRQGAEYAAALRAVRAAIAAECAKGDAQARCEVVALFEGGRYVLYRFHRFPDLRLVFSPEHASADFGGDPDNFEFPRYAFDVAFLRIYDQGRPLAAGADHLRLTTREALPGEPTLVAGNPGHTSRSFTLAQLAEARDVTIPRSALYLAELRGLLTAFVREGAEQQRVGLTDLLGVENALKRAKGLWAALSDPDLMAAKAAAEAELKAKVAADPGLAATVGPAWDEIAGAVARHRALSDREDLLLARAPQSSRLLADALILLRHPAEQAKPDGERLEEYSEAAFPALRQRLLSTAPIAPALESVTLGYWLGKLQQTLGQDDPVVRALLAGRSAVDRAAELVRGTRLGDAALRQRLLEGGQAAIDGARDPMIEFARLLDPPARAVRRQVEEDYHAVLDAAGGRIARARFALYGDSIYPDATFTPRLSYGSVQGWSEGGRGIQPVTRLSGLWRRATGAEPFRLAPSWLAAKDQLDPATPLDFATNNDIIGGNSGSPVIDREGNAVGLIFDGNIHSLGGEYGFDPQLNRAVAVAAPLILAALGPVYREDRLVEELGR